MSEESPFHGPAAARLSAAPPQRYRDNYARYLALGGQPGLEADLKGFLAGGAHDGDLARFYFFSLAFDQIVKEGLGGDFAELGVYKGNTAILLAAYARRRGATAYLLDTYEGFDAKDLTGFDAGIEAQSFTDTSLEAVRAFVGDDNVKYVKGHFPGSAARLPKEGRYCLVHLDCDLYAPMASALAYFYPRLVPGGFLIVHDYSSLHWSGAETAVDEFFGDKPECPLPLPDGCGSVAVRKLRPLGPEGSWLDHKRRALLGADWADAANGKLVALLGEGWSGPEPWGVWGVGDRHIMHVPLPGDGRSDPTLELDVEAVVSPVRGRQVVAVRADGRDLDQWTFTLDDNRGVRRLRLPRGRRDRKASVTLTFAPLSVMPACDVHDCGDPRALGLGLHRMRWAEPPSGEPGRRSLRFWRSGKG
jgi:hypothetical protein